jgi:DNA mismatch repair ATPase MutS
LNLKLANRKYSGGTWPFSGFPVTHLDKYLKILVQDLGQTVVLVEELEQDDNATKTDLIPRKVGRVVTPGTLLDESWLDGNESRYLLALAIGRQPASETEGKLPICLAYTDASTGEFFSKDSDMSQIEDELARVAPREVVLDSCLKEEWETGKGSKSGKPEDLMDLLRVLGVHVSFANLDHTPSLDGLSPLSSTIADVGSLNLESKAITLLRHHLQYALRDSMPSLPNQPQRQLASSHMQIDAATLAALEIRHAIRPGGLVEMPGHGARASAPDSDIDFPLDRYRRYQLPIIAR